MLTRKEGDWASHGVVVLNEMGNGVTEEIQDHHHAIIGFQVEKVKNHTHTMEKIITMRDSIHG